LQGDVRSTGLLPNILHNTLTCLALAAQAAPCNRKAYLAQPKSRHLQAPAYAHTTGSATQLCDV